ncbi:MAG TPA: transposase [Usitatibacter sp.]|nr:transposase [Usitatibacter sp.]
MPRHARLRLPNLPVHVVQRGNNRAQCFWEDRDYLMYLGLLEELAPECGCQVHAFALMTNHVHLLATPAEGNSLSQLMKEVGQRYVQFINRKRRRTGSLWDGRFKSSIVDTQGYFLRCQRYIELNPVRAGMVSTPGAYPWSSFLTNATGRGSSIITPHATYLALGPTERERIAAYCSLFEQGESAADVSAIRHAINGGFAWGSADFVKSLEKEIGISAARRRHPNRLGSGARKSRLSGLTPV